MEVVDALNGSASKSTEQVVEAGDDASRQERPSSGGVHCRRADKGLMYSTVFFFLLFTPEVPGIC